MSESAWDSFEREHEELLRRWLVEQDEDERARMWNEILELWADWKETRK
jgi:hypothetical protein